MSLKDDGFRFMVSLDRKQSNWFAQPDSRCEGWIDCTDMNDVQFEAFMSERTDETTRASHPAGA